MVGLFVTMPASVLLARALQNSGFFLQHSCYERSEQLGADHTVHTITCILELKKW